MNEEEKTVVMDWEEFNQSINIKLLRVDLVINTSATLNKLIN